MLKLCKQKNTKNFAKKKFWGIMRKILVFDLKNMKSSLVQYSDNIKKHMVDLNERRLKNLQHFHDQINILEEKRKTYEANIQTYCHKNEDFFVIICDIVISLWAVFLFGKTFFLS